MRDLLLKRASFAPLQNSLPLRSNQCSSPRLSRLPLVRSVLPIRPGLAQWSNRPKRTLSSPGRGLPLRPRRPCPAPLQRLSQTGRLRLLIVPKLLQGLFGHLSLQENPCCLRRSCGSRRFSRPCSSHRSSTGTWRKCGSLLCHTRKGPQRMNGKRHRRILNRGSQNLNRILPESRSRICKPRLCCNLILKCMASGERML